MEERIKKLELIVNRLMRRSTKTAKALITPYPISNAVFSEDIRGSILRYMFPCDGVISKGMIKLNAKPKGPVRLAIDLVFSDGRGFSDYFVIDRKELLITPRTSTVIGSGTCLNISVVPTDPEERITEAWVSFLWIPTIKDIEVKSYLIEELEKLLPEVSDAI